MARDLVLEVVEQVRGNALGEAADDLDKVAGSTDKAAGSARNYSGDLKKLDSQIESTKLKIRSLGAEFVSTHEKTVGTQLRGERSLLRQLERIRKELEEASSGLVPAGAAAGALAGSRAGQGFVGSFFDAVGSLPSKLRGTLLATALVVAAPLIPAIGAAIAGAVVGGVGTGGMVGGIAAASKDPRVRAAASDFSKTIGEEFFSGGKLFVGPTIEALDILEDKFAALNLDESWARVAPYVTKVADGLGTMAYRIMPGFNRALDAAGPALEILAEELPDIGDAISDMLIDVTESQGTLEGWLFLLKGIGSTIRVTGDLLHWLGNRFHNLLQINEFITGALEDVPFLPFRDSIASTNDRLNDLLDASGRATVGLRTHGVVIDEVTAEYRRLLATQDEYLNQQLGLDEANQQAAEAMLRFKEALKENGKDWRTSTEEGLANRAMLLNLVRAYMELRQQNIANGQDALAATQHYNAQLQALQQLAAQAGATKEVLADLVGDYYINLHLLLTRERQLKDAALPYGLGRISGFAHGGEPPTDGTPFWVGEQGKELLALGPRPQVFSHQQSTAMAGNAAQISKQVGETLVKILAVLEVLQRRQPTVMNVYPTQGMSERELAAVVSRELDWSR